MDRLNIFGIGVVVFLFLLLNAAGIYLYFKIGYLGFGLNVISIAFTAMADYVGLLTDTEESKKFYERHKFKKYKVI